MSSISYKLMFIIYALISIPLFLCIYNTSQLIIDEEFHLKQGLRYCNGDFKTWDPKITTFPGLYLVSTLFLYFTSFCNAFTLRLVSLMASFVNVYFIYEIRKIVSRRRVTHEWKTAFETVTIAFLPPMYFFAHLYYTDILSITTVLGLFLYNMRNEHNIATIFGFLSVLMRQTNIVWVGMALGLTVIDKFVSQTMPFIKAQEKTETRIDNYYTFKDILSVLQFYCRRINLIPKQLKVLSFYLIGYICILVLFLIFLIVNGSIVVGDKEAHEASLHLPQIFYFSLFSLIFGNAILLQHFGDTIRFIVNRLHSILLIGVIIFIIIHFNTIVHQYLLADNRHYVFYVWNRFYGKYNLAKYFLIPIYIFAIISQYKTIQNKSAGFHILLTISIVIVISLQRLIELRYFILPYLLIRLNAAPIKFRALIFEFFTIVLINLITFYLFFTKEIYWNNFNDAQRLIW